MPGHIGPKIENNTFKGGISLFEDMARAMERGEEIKGK
jgi:hypothetical protein